MAEERGFNGIVPENPPNHCCPPRRGSRTNHNPLRICGWLGIAEAVDLLWRLPFNPRSVLIGHLATIAKAPARGRHIDHGLELAHS